AMEKFQIKTESMLKRCEVCHLSDCFVPEKMFCSRCSEIIDAESLIVHYHPNLDLFGRPEIICQIEVQSMIHPPINPYRTSDQLPIGSIIYGFIGAFIGAFVGFLTPFMLLILMDELGIRILHRINILESGFGDILLILSIALCSTLGFIFGDKAW